jgi:hypothetical protein
MRDHRISFDLFNDVIDVLHGHGFASGDDQHVGRAIFLIGDLARIYEGTQDHPFGPSLHQAPDPQPTPEPSAPDRPGTVTIAAGDLKTVLAALDTAADDLRDQAETCTHCPDQSCTACQSRLHAAQAYDQIACRILRPAPTTPEAHHRQAEPPGPTRQPGPADGKEAGQ